ncbi:hypothetical protein D3C74_487420 [compost metagenome]
MRLALGLEQQRDATVDQLAVRPGFVVEPHHQAIARHLDLLQFGRFGAGQAANHQAHHQADNRQRGHYPWE